MQSSQNTLDTSWDSVLVSPGWFWNCRHKNNSQLQQRFFYSNNTYENEKKDIKENKLMIWSHLLFLINGENSNSFLSQMVLDETFTAL